MENMKELKIEKRDAFSNKKYPVIEVPASGESTWSGGAYVLCFVYSKYNGNFVLKGYHKEVREYLKKNYTHYFYNMSFWHHGNNRDFWGFWKDNVGIHYPYNKYSIFKGKNRWKYNVRPYTICCKSEEEKREAEKKQLWFKRMPKRWIPEFDAL
jgi:hypothetical protein